MLLTEADILASAKALAGNTLGSLARSLDIPIPENFLRAKGWVGQLIEIALGAQAGIKAQPDFPELGIELKTLPINAQGKPLESTYVTRVPMLNNFCLTWHESVVYKKLAKVLWMPIEAVKNIPIPKRRIGAPVLWSPSQQEEVILKQDWEEFMELIALGRVATITAHRGTYLQIRPKAANRQSRRIAIDEQGLRTQTLPLGFYLRPSFTEHILKTHYF